MLNTVAMRGALRTLSVLRALNEHNGSTISNLSRVTGIPRPSLYRLLETLCAAGYLTRRNGSDRYHLTLMVRTLSDGFSDEEWIRNIAVPYLRDLQREIVWPVDLATFLGDAMVLRETTRPDSPLTIDRLTVGLRVPMLISATGRAYLAFCPDAEREAIIGNLARSTSPDDAIARDRRKVDQILRETRRNGYGQRSGEITTDTASIAVPVRKKDRVLACVHVAFFARSSTPKEIAARHLKSVQRAAGLIEARLESTVPDG
jgi:IclR family mhp operon transcriptional activator